MMCPLGTQCIRLLAEYAKTTCIQGGEKKPVWPLPFEFDHSHPWNVLVGSYDLHNLKWQLDGVQTKLAGGPLR